MLCDCTGWTRLEPGSLNLHVEDKVVDRLADLRECYFEEPSLIKYPNGRSRIPEWRGGYNYYRALIRSAERTEQILIRRARDRPLKNLVEAYAPVRLVDVLELQKGTVVEIEVRDA